MMSQGRPHDDNSGAETGDDRGNARPMTDTFPSSPRNSRGIGTQPVNNDGKPRRNEDDPPGNDERQNSDDEWQVGIPDALTRRDEQRNGGEVRSHPKSSPGEHAVSSSGPWA